MSYLARLSRRVAVSRSRMSVAMPKGAIPRAPIYRSDAPQEEDEMAAPLRKTDPVRRVDEDQLEEMDVSRAPVAGSPGSTKAVSGSVSRQTDEEAEEEIGRIRRQEDEEDELAPLRRTESAEEPEELAPLRRTEEDEEELAPLRRQEAEEEEEVLAMRTGIRRSPAGETTPRSVTNVRRNLHRAAVADEEQQEEPAIEAMPLRRDTVPAPANPAASVAHTPQTRSVSPDPAAMLPGDPISGNPFPEPFAYSRVEPFADDAGQSQGDVVIEQLDVLIHEPAAPSATRRSTPGPRSRPMRSRYLRRL